MNSSRISDALDQAGGLPAQGRVLLLRPTADNDLSAFPQTRTTIVTGFRPDHDAFAAAGWTVAEQAEGPFAMACLFQPRAKAQGRALILLAAGLVVPGGLIWIDGQKTDGIESTLKDIKARAEIAHLLSKSHGRAFAFANPGPAAFADWAALDTFPAPGFITRPGVFSADAIDAGSALLARHLPAKLKGKGADLGAGWGWLSAQVLAHQGVRELHLVEAEAEALACARRNINDERAQFHWADATVFNPGKALDFVVMNPPFHQSRAADPAIGQGFIRTAQRMLIPSGQLWLVANRTLPYEEALSKAFLQVTPLAMDKGFKVIMAARPVFTRKA